MGYWLYGAEAAANRAPKHGLSRGRSGLGLKWQGHRSANMNLLCRRQIYVLGSLCWGQTWSTFFTECNNFLQLESRKFRWLAAENWQVRVVCHQKTCPVSLHTCADVAFAGVVPLMVCSRSDRAVSRFFFRGVQWIAVRQVTPISSSRAPAPIKLSVARVLPRVPPGTAPLWVRRPRPFARRTDNGFTVDNAVKVRHVNSDPSPPFASRLC